MFKRGLFVVVLLLAMVSMAHANAIITLTATTPENSVGGYLPGTLVDFRVDISQDTGALLLLRGVQLDFSVTDPGLTFSGDFSFDFSSVMVGDVMYTTSPAYPLPWAVYSGTSPIEIFMLTIPASGSLTLGTGKLALPTTQGTYLLDALNADTSETDFGAKIYFDFVNPTQWSISGDSLALNVVTESVPEPATMLLLGFSILGLAGLRRKA